MKILDTRLKKAVAAFILMGAAAALPFLLGFLTVNITLSVPIGLWRASFSSIQKGDFVLVDVESFSGFRRYADYPFRKTWRGRVPFLKNVAGVPGDKISADDRGILVNGLRLPFSKPLSQDRRGYRLEGYPLPVLLEDRQFWLTSSVDRGFDSRYLGTVTQEQCQKVVPVLLF